MQIFHWSYYLCSIYKNSLSFLEQDDFHCKENITNGKLLDSHLLNTLKAGRSICPPRLHTIHFKSDYDTDISHFIWSNFHIHIDWLFSCGATLYTHLCVCILSVRPLFCVSPHSCLFYWINCHCFSWCVCGGEGDYPPP